MSRSKSKKKNRSYFILKMSLILCAFVFLYFGVKAVNISFSQLRGEKSDIFFIGKEEGKIEIHLFGKEYYLTLKWPMKLVILIYMNLILCYNYLWLFPKIEEEVYIWIGKRE